MQSRTAAWTDTSAGCTLAQGGLGVASTSQQTAGSAPEGVEVVDVAHMLLAPQRRRRRKILEKIQAWLSIRRQGVRRP
jgi:hypothetical protein